MRMPWLLGGKVFWCGGVGRSSVALGYGDASGSRYGEGDWKQGTILGTRYWYRWNEGDEKQKRPNGWTKLQ
jgi:hypothetical protein